MRIDILTLFPEMFTGFINNSIIKRTIEKDLVNIYLHDFRLFSLNKHHKVDDTPYGGGAGMLLSLQPIIDCLRSIPNYQSAYKILTSARGKVYSQQKALAIAGREHLIIICGHYEGIDERILDYIDEELSIGDYIMTGGEIASLVLIDTVIRLLPEAIKAHSLENESFSSFLLEYAQYTKPAIFEEKKVPEVLISGNHEEIRKYRLFSSLKKTYNNRPELIDTLTLTKEAKIYLEKIKNGEEF